MDSGWLVLYTKSIVISKLLTVEKLADLGRACPPRSDVRASGYKVEKP